MINKKCNCGRSLKLRDELAGKRVKCPECGDVVNVPSERSRAPAAMRNAKKVTARKPKKKSKPRRPVEQDDLFDDQFASAPKRKRSKRKKSRSISGKFIAGAIVGVSVLVAAGILAVHFGKGIAADLNGDIVEPKTVEFKGYSFELPGAAEIHDEQKWKINSKGESPGYRHAKIWELPSGFTVTSYEFYPEPVTDIELQKLVGATNARDSLAAMRVYGQNDSKWATYDFDPIEDVEINGILAARRNYRFVLTDGDSLNGRIYVLRDGRRQMCFKAISESAYGSGDFKRLDNICATIRKTSDAPLAESPQEERAKVEAVVLQRWEEFLAAQQSGNSRKIAEMMHSQSVPVRRELQNMALTMTGDELNREDLWKVMSVLSLRAAFTRSELQNPAVNEVIGTMSSQSIQS